MFLLWANQTVTVPLVEGPIR